MKWVKYPAIAPIRQTLSAEFEGELLLGTRWTNGEARRSSL